MIATLLIKGDLEMFVHTSYSIPVATIKNSVDYSYSATDTVQNLKQRICAVEGIPADKLVLKVAYGWRNLWARVDISDLDGELLINHLQTASKIELYIKL